MGWVVTTRDSMGRPTLVQHYPGGGSPGGLTSPPYVTYPAWGSNTTSTGAVATSYSGSSTTVKDEANNAHVNTVDGLGRLASVQEANGNTTPYGYDLLNNLTSVSMPGQPARTFTYNWLSRLASASNLENGTIQYAYDKRGNLIQRKDARNTIMCAGDAPSGGTCPGTVNQTQLAYDGLGRIRKRSYSDGTPPVSYAYDASGDAKGTLSSVTNTQGGAVVSSTLYTHDWLGRVVASTQTTGGTTFPALSYAYSLSDQLTSLTYPSGRKVTYGFDNADRVLTVGGTKNYTASGQNINYTAAGGFVSVPLGSTVTENYTWNDRLQQTGISAGALALQFYPCDNGGVACTTNNGNIWRETVQNVNLAMPVTQEYRYDNLNRLISASEGSNWSRTFGYDAYGNMWVPTSTGVALDSTTPKAETWINAANNRLVNSGMNVGYDSAGNLTSISGYAWSYDAENRLTSSTLGGATTTYLYDGEGRRVMKQVGSATTTLIYDAGGQLAAEYASQPTAAPCATCYLTADHLGSTRMMTDAGGVVKSLHDYLPFGEEIQYGVGGRSSSYYPNGPLVIDDTVTPKFTGKERDVETGLDYFGARYLSSAQGRWTIPDWSAREEAVPYADLHDPQTLNLYAYVWNNPLSRRDLDGHCADHYKDGTCKVNVNSATGEAGTKAGKQLEGVLNNYDKAINALDNKAKIDIKDSKGNVVGTMTGKEIKAVWNGTHFTITDKSFNNGGAGGGTAGSWKLFGGFSGKSELTPGAVKAYVDGASGRNEAPLVGLSTLTFHELAHETHFGEALTAKYPVTDKISPERETGTSSAGKAMSGAVEAPFDCGVAGGCK